MAELTQGWNASKVTEINEEIKAAFLSAGAGSEELIKKIETTVQETWIGPDAEIYLDEVATKFNSLVQEAGTMYTQLAQKLEDVSTAWSSFQARG